MIRYAFTAFVIVLTAWATPAQAGGYDTPILYTARHMGMGGTAISYVDEASALFHNPAGLGHTGKGSFSLALSPLTGDIRATPDSAPGKDGGPINLVSEPAFAPFFLGGGSYRVSDTVALGFAVYPVASAGASYKYNPVDYGAGSYLDSDRVNMTKIVFIEASPGVGITLPGNIRIGAGYRMSMVTLEREEGAVDNPSLKLDLKGYNFKGFRVGAQWHKEFEGGFFERIDFGTTYRHKTKTVVSADSAVFLTDVYKRTEMDFTLPSKLGFGTRIQAASTALAIDFEWGFNSQNPQSSVLFSKNNSDDVDGEIQANDGDQELLSLYNWTDAPTIRVGLEKEFELGTKKARSLKPRLGYVYDGKTANEKFPTAFGTPPAPTQTYTAGIGYETENYEFNVAYAFRSGSTTILAENIEGNACVTCGDEGDYELNLHGIYVDYTHYFD